MAFIGVIKLDMLVHLEKLYMVILIFKRFNKINFNYFFLKKIQSMETMI